jgi:hypothetical protein
MHGISDEKNPNDMIEYHVIQNGVDKEAVLSFAREAFAEVTFFRISPVNLNRPIPWRTVRLA